ncbi:MAG: Na+/H+ antiporter subunit D [Anaerolineales bacterium]|nr:Na+/H+ antiporter subunit D [Anaerolineales bacterium]
MTNLLIYPLIIPLITAALMLVFWRLNFVQNLLGLTGAAGILGASIIILFNVYHNGIQVIQIGNWPAPFGLTFVADLFSSIMVVMTGLMGLAIVIYSIATIDSERRKFGYFPLLNILLMGVSGAFLTGDIFNLYVWFEVMLIASFVLLALGGEQRQILGAIKYVTLNLLSSALFLAGVGLLYATTGTMNMADLAVKLQMVEQTQLINALSMLFLIAFGIKAAMFPLFFWLPASYHTPPVAVSAIFAALLTKVGVYALIRVFTLLFIQDTSFTHTIILILAGFTMVTGVLGAVAQNDFRRLLSFHIISQIGYLLMGLGLLTVQGLAGSVIFMVHVILAKSTLFLVSGVSYHLYGTYDLKKLGGLYQNYPLLALLFMIPALSLAGIPPLSGFFAKFALVVAGVSLKQYFIIATSLIVSILTLFSMMKIWNEAFWKPLPVSTTQLNNNKSNGYGYRKMGLMLFPIVILSLFIVIIGIAADPVYSLALQAAEQLLHTSDYIQAVLGGAS